MLLIAYHPTYTAHIEHHSRPLRGRLSGIAVDSRALRRARLEAGLTLAQVAGSEVTRQAVHQVETGRARPSLRTLEAIAGRLGRPVSDFLSRAPDGGVPVPSTETGTTELERLCLEHRYPEALEAATSQIERESAIRPRAVAHLYAGRALLQLARPGEAEEHLRTARQLFEAAGDPWGAAEALDWEGSAAYLQEQVEAAFRLGEEIGRAHV